MKSKARIKEVQLNSRGKFARSYRQQDLRIYSVYSVDGALRCANTPY